MIIYVVSPGLIILFNNYMSKYILIVGGTGYTGSHINLDLNCRGYNTLIFDNLSNGQKESVLCG